MSDGLTLNPDGTATLNLNGSKVTLRVPNLGEYGDLIDLVDYGRFQALGLLTEAGEERKKIKGTDKDKGEQAFRKAKEKERAADEIRAGFIVEASKRLGDKELEPSTLPRWAVSNDLINKLLNHWETVPFPGSAPGM